MTTDAQLEASAAALAQRMSPHRGEAIAYAYGFLDQVIKRFLDGDFTLADLRHHRALLEHALDLHREREDRTC